MPKVTREVANGHGDEHLQSDRLDMSNIHALTLDELLTQGNQTIIRHVQGIIHERCINIKKPWLTLGFSCGGMWAYGRGVYRCVSRIDQLRCGYLFPKDTYTVEVYIRNEYVF